jgi:tetratricopeptide (TPR) repeat protein
VELGEALRAEKRYVDAEREYDNALDLDKEFAPALKGKAAAMNGPKADNYIKEAKARAAKGEYEYAVAYFQKAFDLVGDPSTKALLDEAKSHKKK